jgi:hypothetical protein
MTPIYLTDRIVDLGLGALKHHQEVVLPFITANLPAPPSSERSVTWATLQLRFHRRAGHSTAALQLLALVPGSILTLPYHRGGDNLEAARSLRRAAPEAEQRNRIITAERRLEPDSFRPFIGTPLVIIDDAFWLSDTLTYDGLTDIMSAVSPDTFFLLLG